MTLSPIISETHAFYELFFGENGIIRQNATMIEQPVLGGESAAAETLPAAEAGSEGFLTGS